VVSTTGSKEVFIEMLILVYDQRNKSAFKVLDQEWTISCPQATCGPQKHSGNIFRCEICVSLHLLQYCFRQIKFIYSKPKTLEPFLYTINVFVSLILQSN